MTVAKHLWEVTHPYYCNEGNLYAAGCGQEFKSFANFLEAEGRCDLDYNLVFRWDWQEIGWSDEGNEINTFTGDENYRNGKLLVFIMNQRKGAYRWCEVEVCRADEPAVIAYLAPRWKHMRALWEPMA